MVEGPSIAVTEKYCTELAELVKKTIG
jgi:hypothetical protein